MFGAYYYVTPRQAIDEVQTTYSLTDDTLAARLNVTSVEIKSWRQGTTQIPRAMQRRLRELVALTDALNSARSGKYRQA